MARQKNQKQEKQYFRTTVHESIAGLCGNLKGRGKATEEKVGGAELLPQSLMLGSQKLKKKQLYKPLSKSFLLSGKQW